MIKKIILTYVYSKYKHHFENLIIEDLLSGVPEDVKKIGLENLGKSKDKIVKWLYFEANSIYRRSPLDFSSLERRNGMLIFIYALIRALSDIEITKKEHPIYGETESPPPEWIDNIKKFNEARQKKETDKKE